MKENTKLKRCIKQIRGVTMLALVVTIIVLLILAAITLNLAVGENGIIERAKLARDKAKNASIAEEEAMNEAAGEIDNAGSGGSGSGGGTCPECPDTKPLEDRIKELESQVGVLQQQLEEERANKQELENRITELNNQIAELNKQIEAGNTEKAKLQEEITKLQNQLTASQTENEKLQAQIERLNTTKAKLEAEITKLQNQLTASQTENEKLKAQIEKLNTQKAELESEITKLQNQLTASQTENGKLQAQITELNKQVTNLNTQLGEKNKTIETQKQQIANLQGQITEKDKIISQKNETIKTMQSTIDGLNTQIANLNKQIETLKAKQATGNVTVGEVLKGKTFSNSSEVGLVGTMANNGALNKSLNAGQSFKIPAGYTTGGTVTANSLASQTGGTAVAGDILTGKTAWVNGNKVTGTMEMKNNNYIMGSEYVEKDLFTPSTEANNRNTQSVNENGFICTKQKVDITNVNKIKIKVHYYKDSNDGVFGMGISKTMPTSINECMNISSKVTFTGGNFLANNIKVLEYDVSNFSGEYYLFCYTKYENQVGIFYWKME